MKRHWRKGAIAFVALVMVAFMASSAMAIILTGRSEEMTANSSCDLAGTIDLKFNETDYVLIQEYLSDVNTPLLNGYSAVSDPNDAPWAGRATSGTANFVLIRATLGGTNIEITSDEPRLCKDIVGAGSGLETLGAAGTVLPNDDKLVVLDEWNVEVSDISNNRNGGVNAETLADGYEDVIAYAYGQTGQQFFSIYLTDLARARNWDDETTWPWIKVGLYQRVTPTDAENNPDDDGYPTSICVDVHDFGTLATLNVSLDIEPTQLTYTTSDNQIGHFLEQNIDLRDCDKGESCPPNGAVSDDTIELCPIGEQENCMTYYTCIVAEGTYPSSGEIQVTVRSNGATSGANTQEGIYIAGVSLYNEQGALITAAFEYYEADGTTLVTDLDCTFDAEMATADMESGDLNGDEVTFCIYYQVNEVEIPRDAEGEILNPTVQFWINLASVPCGDLLNEAYSVATLEECGQGANCMYFPYVLHGFSAGSSGLPAWSTGVVITNLSEGVAVEDMEITVTMTDSAGTAFTGMIPADMITSKVVSLNVDGLIAAMGWEPAAGPAWVWVQGNFMIDGYHFMFAADLGFGAGTLPRVLDHCTMQDFK